MAIDQLWRIVPGKLLMLSIHAFILVALIFEGYNQGVYGTVSGTPGFIRMAKLGYGSTVTDTTKQGGLAAAYYFGALFGCFIGGWVGDKYGRRTGVFIGAVTCTLGGALQAGSINANMFICARVIAGLGMGFINAIVPPWVSELAQAHDRGSSFSFVFIANFLGIAVASWLNFGVRTTNDEFRWRFPLGFMCIPVLINAITVWFIPESPRWLMANGHRQEAIDILCKVRGDLKQDDPAIKEELYQLDAIVRAARHKRNNILNLLLGGRYSGKLHLGRRAVLGLALQQIQQWTGIIAVVTWSSRLFILSGFDEFKSLWLAGLINTLGIPATAAAGLVIDRIGRRSSLQVSFIIQGVCQFAVAGLIKTSEDRVVTNPGLSQSLGTAASSFVFIYLWFFCMFNLVPCWLYGTEIWPQEVRAKGYSFTVLGWAIGCGMTTLVIPIMLEKLGWYTFIFFGLMNIVVMPIIHFFYVETAGRSLEEVNLLFTSDSQFVSNNMKEYERRISEAQGSVPMATQRLMYEVNQDDNAISSVGDMEKNQSGSVDQDSGHEMLDEKR